MTNARKPCSRCGGGGLVLRERRKLASGKPDPMDFRWSELCPACGGDGTVPDTAYRRPDRAVRGGGWLADQIVAELSALGVNR